MIRGTATSPEKDEPATLQVAANGFEPIARVDFDRARDLIQSRRHVGPRWLVDPGPNSDQLEELLWLAAAAPDHGRLIPWRFVLVPAESRHLLGRAFALALLDRDPGASEEQLVAAREKADRAPVLMGAIACTVSDMADVPLVDQLVSLGAAIQNVQLGAVAMGFSVGLSSGRAMDSVHVRLLFELAESERAVCCISIGRSVKSNGIGRVRPNVDHFFGVLGAPRSQSL